MRKNYIIRNLIEVMEQVKQYSGLVENKGTNSQKLDEDLIVL